MKKHYLILLLTIHFTFLQMNSQVTATKVQNNYAEVPHQEQVYVHTNSRLVFVGEYLYYTIYCLKENTGQLSDVSKIAYLKLVNENKEVVLNQKIKLTNGIGDSNFFIPSSVPSGNYKLVAYTQWMLNNGRNYFYDLDVTVINPYTSNQTVFREKNTTDLVESSSTGASSSLKRKQPLRLELDKTSYTKRAAISMKIASNTLEGLGNYSISVRKVDELESKDRNTSFDFQKGYPQKRKIEKLILPELRGELIQGVLGNMATSTVENTPIGVSFPGEDYLFKIAVTDRDGRFYINVDEDYDVGEMYLQVLSQTDTIPDVTVFTEEALDFSHLDFSRFILDRGMESAIKERSIHNQIENAYYSSKPDTILIGKPNDRFYGPGSTKYLLDDYTRFPSIKETFVEVVEHVWLQKNKNGKNEFHVRPIAPYVESGKLPLVFVDGILILDHERVLGLSANQIKSINISRDQHFYGTTTFQGVVDITTFNGDYYKNYYTENLEVQKLFKPNEDKNYYRQSYEGPLKEKYERLPDFRYQLLWYPNYKLDHKEQRIEFYSSDITGEFEISFEGFTEKGVPVSLHKRFEVN
ncbi:hypothetical protein [Maribacter thermophilus]|uniref:hypothetical protein n=1 Tax=Maribacter thermophilus TaxID=1197874 RepID=UPI000640C546|nr:hypothetical protein [Maribacter thermophilus]